MSIAAQRAEGILHGSREIAMEHPGHQGNPAGVGQSRVRLDDVVTPTYFGFGADGLRCLGLRTDIVNAKISERGA
jgi:hypothetical protein